MNKVRRGCKKRFASRGFAYKNMPRSRSRSSSSSSSRSSDSSDSEAEERARERKRIRKHQRKERREQQRLEREEERKAKEALRVAGAITWEIKDKINNYTIPACQEDDEEEDEHDDEPIDNSEVMLRGSKPRHANAATVDCTDFDKLEVYLRKYFQIHLTNKNLLLRLKYCTISEPTEEEEDPSEELKLSGRATDATTLDNWWDQLAAAVARGKAIAKHAVYVELHSLKPPVSIKRAKKPESKRAATDRELFTKLVTSIYGENPGHFAEGEWTVESSEIMRNNLQLLRKFLAMRTLTQKVMNNADYMPNPCVMVCPFDGAKCTHGIFRMNGACKPSQLYSHWQHAHKDNPMCKQLEACWRRGIKNRHLSQDALWEPVRMEVAAEDCETKRDPPMDGAHFPHDFLFGSNECTAWLNAVNTL